MNDLGSPQVRAILAQRVINEYNEASVELFREGFRNHLGASVIGEPCARLLWYQFRWFHNNNPGGRMYRLFQRGHREEPFAIQHLRKRGFVVNDVDPSNGKQWRMSALHDHFGGSCDGRGFLPESFEYPFEVGFEFKTSNARRFKEMKKDGVRKAKPKHAAQMDTYGKAWGIKYFVYFFFNKDDDDIHVEIYECDWVNADRLMVKAEHVVSSQLPPARLSENSTFTDCKYCDLNAHCHYGAQPEKNCRSCRNARPTYKGQWQCGLVDEIIPPEVIVRGCDKWVTLPNV